MADTPGSNDYSPALPSKRWGALVVGTVVSALLLWWALQGVDLRQAWAAAVQADRALLLLAVVLATATFPLRIPRWRILLSGETAQPLSSVTAWQAVSSGFMANNLLPFRAGEFLRAFVIHRTAGVRFTAALSSIAGERVFDGIVVTATFIVTLGLNAIPSEAMIFDTPVGNLASRAALISAVLLAAAVIVVASPHWFTRVISRLLPWPRAAAKLEGLVQGAASGLSVLTSPSQALRVVIWSGVVWSVNALSFYVAARAFGLELGIGAAFFLQGLIVFGVAIPSTPGFIGVFEGVIVAGLGLLGVERDIAFAYAVTYHATTFLPITILGLISLQRLPISLTDIFSRRR